MVLRYSMRSDILDFRLAKATELLKATNLQIGDIDTSDPAKGAARVGVPANVRPRR